MRDHSYDGLAMGEEPLSLGAPGGRGKGATQKEFNRKMNEYLRRRKLDRKPWAEQLSDLRASGRVIREGDAAAQRNRVKNGLPKLTSDEMEKN